MPAERGSATEVFRVFLRIGLTSFGGPVAHLGYFRAELVTRRRWLDEAAYADIVALCQFLPGPASSQTGISLGILRAGLPGAFAAWLGFTMPSAIALILFGYGVARFGDLSHAAWLHGLKIVAVAVVAQAVWGMAHGLLKDVPRAIIAALAAVAAIALPFAFTQLAVIAAAGLIGFVVVRPPAQAPALPPLPVRGTVSAGALILFVALLGGALIFPSFAAAFYRSGALVFGGGHVVLPLLQKAVVDTGWVDRATFLAGYGAAQAMPGPLFSFAAFLGAATHGIGGAALALGAIYLPSFLLVLGAAPLWHEAHRHPALRAGIAAINAAVVGLLAAALYTPVWTGAVTSPEDGLIAVLLTLLLIGRNVPPWVIVILGIVLALVVPR
jgi:chromate transporter